MDRDVFICSSNRRRLSQRAMWYHSLDQCSGWLQWLHQSRTRSNRLTIFGSTRPLPWYIFLCALCCNSLGLSPFQFVSSMSRPSLWCCMTTCFISLSRTSNVFHTVFKIVLVASTWVSSLISLSRVFLFRSILSFFCCDNGFEKVQSVLKVGDWRTWTKHIGSCAALRLFLGPPKLSSVPSTLFSSGRSRRRFARTRTGDTEGSTVLEKWC